MTSLRPSSSHLRALTPWLALAVAYAALPPVLALGPAKGALLVVAISVGTALVAGGPSPISIVGGSVAALSIGLLARVPVPLAGGCFLSLVLAQRTLAVRGATARAAHLALAFGGGAVAMMLVFGFAASPPGARLAAAILSAVAASVPMLVATGEPRQGDLRRAAEQLGHTAAELDRLGGVLREIERAPEPGGPYRSG